MLQLGWLFIFTPTFWMEERGKKKKKKKKV